MKPMLAMLALLTLGGCITDGTTPASVEPVCEALTGPIRYNTFKPDSTRYAGPALAPDLKKQNQVGELLHCPGY
jgi:hypothetical protein